jgi:hypothetical protein
VAEDEGNAIGGTPEGTDPIPDDPSPSRPWLARAREPAAPSPPDTCRFLATANADGTFGAAGDTVDEDHRCVALGDSAPQSARQQELVCLTAAHRNCPRFLRGTLLENSPVSPPAREPIAPAVIVASLVLVATIAASFGFLAVRGGLSVALANPSPGASQVAVVPAASVKPVATPSIASTPAPTPSGTPEPTPSSTPSATPAATPAVTPPPATATPRPSSDRYLLLSPCPSAPSCWLYTVRSGDNLVSIAHYFGVPLDTVYAMNPWARTTGLRAGQELRLPPPTR